MISTFVDAIFNYILVTVGTFKTILSSHNSLFCWQSFIFDFKRFITGNRVADEITEDEIKSKNLKQNYKISKVKNMEYASPQIRHYFFIHFFPSWNRNCSRLTLRGRFDKVITSR